MEITTRTIEARPGLGLDLREAGAGAGEPLLILHGGAGPASIDALIAHCASGRHVLAPTHPGWAGTERPQWLTGVGLLAEIYREMLAGLGLTGVTVLGSSFGGWVAAEMAVGDSGRQQAGLILMDAIGPQIPGHPVTAPGPPPTGAASPTTGSVSPPGGGRGPGPEAMATLRAYAGPAMQDPTLVGRVTRVPVPAFLIWGENDTVVPPAFGRAYAEAFPDGRFELVPGGGHLPYRDAPAATFAILDTVLGR